MKRHFPTKTAKAFGAAVLAGLALVGCGINPNNTSSPSARSNTTPTTSVTIQETPSGTSDGPTIALQIDGPAAHPKMERPNTRDQDDLDASIPGTGIAIGGDGKHGYPQIHIPGVYDGNNPLQVPWGTRPLPTGTAVGPNGEQYAFYAIVPYNNPDGSPNYNFTSPDTVVVDLAHPETPLFTLPGISQASGAYDAQSGRMIIMGNTPSGDRALWQSAPVSQNAAWNTTLQPLGTFCGAMNGNRESQIVALPNGGLLAVGVGNYTPIVSVTATTPQGLLTAAPTALVTWKMLPGAYGPTITDIKESNGQLVVSMRVSTFGGDQYDPHTYKTTFTVKRGASWRLVQKSSPTIKPRV